MPVLTPGCGLSDTADFMADPAHNTNEANHSEQTTSDVDISLKIEQLLLSGLDHYFKGRYDRAIDVWSRVLFLDRSHARARAYIDRARAAVAERLRESEELVHTGVEAFERGDVREARSLLRSAVERGGGRDDALSILERLDRLEAASGAGVAARRGGARVRAKPDSHSTQPTPVRSPVRIVPLIGLGGAVLIIAYLTVSGVEWSPWSASPSIPVRPATVATEPLLVPDPSELDIARARRLIQAGRLHEALVLLDSISPGDPLVDESDQLRARIQRQLLEPSSLGGSVD